MIALSLFNFLREQTLINWSNLFQLHKIILAGTANAPRADFEATAALADSGDACMGNRSQKMRHRYLRKVGYYFIYTWENRNLLKLPMPDILLFFFPCVWWRWIWGFCLVLIFFYRCFIAFFLFLNQRNHEMW